MLAFLAVSVIESFFGPLFKASADATRVPFLGDLRNVAALVGVGLCFAYQLDLLLAAGFRPSEPVIGYVLTGLVYTTRGRGSNYLHQFVEQFFLKTVSQTSEVDKKTLEVKDQFCRRICARMSVRVILRGAIERVFYRAR